MSVEIAKSFIQHIESTHAAETVMDAFNPETGAWDLDKLVEHGKAAGFTFSSEDIGTAITDMPAGELSDEDLDRVSGGLSCSGNCYSPRPSGGNPRPTGSSGVSGGNN